jgi:hypothetical protein
LNQGPPIEPSPLFPSPRFTARCASCQQPIDPKTALYSPAGELVCNGCFGSAEVEHRLTRASTAVAWGTLGVGILSIFCNPFFIFTLIAVGNGVAALRLLVRPEVKTALGARHSNMLVVTIVGLVIAGGFALLRLGLMALTMILRH